MESPGDLVLDRLLSKLEGDSKVTGITHDGSGLALWPFIRHQTLFYFAFTKRNFASVGKGHSATKWQVIRTLIFAVWKNAFILTIKSKPIWIVNSGITNVKTGNKYFNRLADYFYQVKPNDTIELEETAYGMHSLPRIHREVYSHLSIRILAKVLSFFLYRSEGIGVQPQVDRLFAALEERLSDEEYDADFLKNLRHELLAKFRTILAEYAIYKFLFKYGKPKILLVEDASYGSKSHLIKAAKDLAIPVAEYQHGQINHLHIAYNFGPSVGKSSYVNFLPDFFLTFGSLWGDMIQLPVKKVNIGNPHLAESVEKAKGITKEKIILVLGSGTNSEEMIDLVLRLAKRYKSMGYQLIFRPHPLEWATLDSVYKRVLDEKIAIDTTSNLYNSLQRAEVVVSELSTALYEAKAFVNKVYIIRNYFAESFGDESINLFPILKANAELDLAGDNKAGESNHQLWERNWKKNYEEFIRSVINSNAKSTL
ncbi:hypothetical protein [Chryseolinea sp. H1M3-3]|uniref:hypothetical protein n=1 Tax=Chryseolinea sp. H1M3-3 TaxID=3034144 RepID=UPI0023EC23E5|nr:hypothetical protein [Chryseolinea sp. H1M3-3]